MNVTPKADFEPRARTLLPIIMQEEDFLVRQGSIEKGFTDYMVKTFKTATKSITTDELTKCWQEFLFQSNADIFLLAE